MLNKYNIRALSHDDIPGVAALLMRISQDHRWRGQLDCEAYFRHVLFDSPWRDAEIPSWVARSGDEIVGFWAILPRPMELDGRRIRVAVACQAAIDPRHRKSLVVFQLAKACLSGPQDLTLADGANADSNRLWSVFNGTNSLLYGLHWIRLLRPARYVLSELDERAILPHAVAVAARPLGALVDMAAARLDSNLHDNHVADVAENDLDPVTMLSHLTQVMHDNELRPVYDQDSLRWLLEEAASKSSLGTLRSRAVRSEGRLKGWYLYYLRPGATSEVLQIAACRGAFGDVLACLFADAMRGGAAALRGRVDPRHISELSDRHCWMRRWECFVLVHSRRPDVLDAIQRGRAALSRLEGEWWLRFRGA